VAVAVAAVGGLNAQTVVTADVALRALRNLAGGRHLMRIVERETGGAVIEDAGRPGGNGMATGAGAGGRREIRGHVVGHIATECLGAIPGGLVATHAVGRGETVIVVDVAGSAGRGIGRHVRAGQGKASRGVIEGALISPGDGVMAGRTLGNREGRLVAGVRGVIGGVVGGQVAVAVAAVGGLDAQTVVATDVALRALRNLAGGRHLMRVGEREAGGAVIEDAGSPSGDGMATGAGTGGGGEVCGHVVRHIAAHGLRAVPGGLVATHAIGRGETVIVVDVAGSAGRGIGRHVRAGEGKTCNAVVERR